MEIVSPSGRVYQWSKPTPPTAEDIAALQQFDAQQAPAPRTQPRQPNAGAPQFDPSMMMDGIPSRMQPPTNEDVAALGMATRRGAGMVADTGMEAGGATLGQMAGAATGPFAPAAVPLMGGAGAAIGNALGQMRRGDTFSPGQVGGAFVAGMVPGGSLAKAGMGTVAKEAVKQGAGNLAAKTVETALDEQRLPTAGETALAAGTGVVGTAIAKRLDTATNAAMMAEALKRSQDATRRKTLEYGRELGYVLPPSILRPNLGNDALNSLGGKAAMAQEAVRRNQPMTNAAVREELGLGVGDALSPQLLNNARLGPNSVYREVAAVSPQAKIMLDTFKQAQADSNTLFATYRNQFPKDPSVLALAKQRQIDADDMVTQIAVEAQAAGKTGLVSEFEEARIKLAKIGLAERALNKGDGSIKANVIGDAFKNGEKLTGNFLKIGRFQNAFAQSVREAAKTPPSGVNQLLPMLAGSIATYGGLRHGPSGLAMAIPFLAAPYAAREVALSKFFQDRLQPSYGPTRQDALAMMARLGTESAGRNQFLQGQGSQTGAPAMAQQAGPTVRAQTNFPVLTPDQVQSAPPGKFRGVNGQIYEKLPDGTIRQS